MASSGGILSLLSRWRRHPCLGHEVCATTCRGGTHDAPFGQEMSVTASQWAVTDCGPRPHMGLRGPLHPERARSASGVLQTQRSGKGGSVSSL